jgi:hypothetical protein
MEGEGRINFVFAFPARLRESLFNHQKGIREAKKTKEKFAKVESLAARGIFLLRGWKSCFHCSVIERNP